MATMMWATLRADGCKLPSSSGKDAMVLTAMAFELDKKTAEAVANLAGLGITDIAFNSAGRGGGERMPIVDWIDTFAYVVGFLLTPPYRYRTREQWERSSACSRSKPVWKGRLH